MFCDFRHVWQSHTSGCKFRMFIIDEKIRNDELNDKSNLLFQLTGMKPDQPETIVALAACSQQLLTKKTGNNSFADKAIELILNNALV